MGNNTESNKYQVSFTKIIAIYSFFYIILKGIAVYKNAWVVPNVIMASSFLLLGIISSYVVFAKKYNWHIVIIGVLWIALVRYFEVEWLHYLQEYFSK
jgi:hypothetical protein